MTQWENIIFAASLLEIGNKANDAKKSTRLYGKFKNKGKWIYWTKINIEKLPESYAKHFTTETDEKSTQPNYRT